MKKVDFKKEDKSLYNASAKKVSFVEVPKMQFLMIDGQGDPNNNPLFQEAIGAVYGIAYTLKFMLKFDEKQQPKEYFDFVVPPLESLWWMDGQKFDEKQKSKWKWTVMVRQAEYVNAKLLAKAIEELTKKGKDTPAMKKVRLEKFHEGKAAQVMHIGPYNEVGKSLKQIWAAFDEKGVAPARKHHEIYYNDPRKTAPEKLKTLVRHPYK